MFRKILVLALGSALFFGVSGPASAQLTANPTATVTVAPGALSIVSNGGSVTFPSVTLDGTDKPPVAATAAPVLTLTDATGSGAGWNVAVVSTDFQHDTLASTTIPVANFSYAPTGGTITRVSGQGITNPGGPAETGVAAAPLGTAVKSVVANANFGRGRYTWSPAAGSFTLGVPAETLAGSYTATMTFTISSGP